MIKWLYFWIRFLKHYFILVVVFLLRLFIRWTNNPRAEKSLFKIKITFAKTSMKNSFICFFTKIWIYFFWLSSCLAPNHNSNFNLEWIFKENLKINYLPLSFLLIFFETLIHCCLRYAMLHLISFAGTYHILKNQQWFCQ